ncbi:hypothetical protein F4778DRAFT_750405 [Xylariomycetidae sp. FL2044]|nr:hypothetical protein F4778DRAFT_750405 [Xylariomycetidae sp. FL2044]
MTGRNENVSPSIMDRDSDDPNVSIGDCYAQEKAMLDAAYLPCGNAAVSGHQSCCMGNDVCLEDGVCFSSLFDYNYLAGCTNKMYRAKACPEKGDYRNQDFVGLRSDERCHQSACAMTGCRETNRIVTDGMNTSCKFDQNAFKVLVPAKERQILASLPSSRGEKISWGPAHNTDPALSPVTGTLGTTFTTAIGGVVGGTIFTTTFNFPRTSITRTAVATSSTDQRSSQIPFHNTTGNTTTPRQTTLSILGDTAVPSSTRQTSPAQDPPTTSPASSRQAMSVGEQAGIGVGAGVGGLIIMCLVAIALLLHRRRKQATGNAAGSNHTYPEPTLPTIHSPPSVSSPGPNSSSMVEAGVAYPGFKSELVANEPSNSRAAIDTPSTPVSSPPPPRSTPTQKKTFQAYDPRVHGDYAHEDSVISDTATVVHAGSVHSPISTASPQLTGGPEENPRPAGGSDGQGQPRVVIHELQ